MFERIKLNKFEDYFVPCSGRSKKGVYICRLTKYNDEVHKMICNLIEAARKSGVCISQRIGNPDENQLRYYDEMMGRDFQLNPNFFAAALKKWLPRVKDRARTEIANGFYDIFLEMQRDGKNDNMVKNAYIKFMCWLYYKFEPILHQLGNDQPPKIIFEGYPNDYELKMFRILAGTGCDLLFLQYNGNADYLKVDPAGAYSEELQVSGGAFPEGYSLMEIRKKLFQPAPRQPVPRQPAAARVQMAPPSSPRPAQAAPVRQPVSARVPELKVFKPEKMINSNAWIQGEPFADSLLRQEKRGTDPTFFYQVFAGVYGVESKAGYFNSLITWKMKLESYGNYVLLIEEQLPAPDFEEINRVKRGNYQFQNIVLNEMVMQVFCADRKLQNYCQNGFMQVMKDKLELPIQKLMNLSVVMVCWINRYAAQLASKWKDGAAFVYYGEVEGEQQRTFFSILSHLPIDILVINPEIVPEQQLTDQLFFAKHYPLSLKREPFPKSLEEIQFGTAAYEAQQDLNTIMYQDTGMFRNHQFKKAIPVLLQVTYDEISILWKQEAKYRPNFETFDDRVMVPVIFSKVSGVVGRPNQYWDKVCNFIEDDVFLIKDLPYTTGGGDPRENERLESYRRRFPNASQSSNPFKEKAYTYLHYGKLQRDKIKHSSSYPFSFIREPMQDYMLDKMQEMIDQKLILGTGTNGMENTIVATILNMDKRLLRLVQQYDFTKQVPKVVVLHTGETSCPPEDSILLAFLHKIGFDVLLFVPTGYASIERYYSKALFVEHQIGEFKYDLQIQDFETVKKRREGLAGKIFRRGW